MSAPVPSPAQAPSAIQLSRFDHSYRRRAYS